MGSSSFRVIEATDERVHDAQRTRLLGSVHRFRAADGFEALIPQLLIEQVVALSQRAEPNEWLGVIVGRVGEDEQGSYVVIDGVVLDTRAIATPGSVRSTPEGERAVRQIAEAAYPTSTFIGWGHGHYRCGTQFSAGDRRNQATWTASHAIGIVCDPSSPEKVGVYRGPRSERLSLVGPLPLARVEGAVAPTKGGHPTDRPSNRRPMPGAEHDKRVVASALAKAAAACGVLVLCGIVWIAFMRGKEHSARLDLLERAVQELENEGASGDDDDSGFAGAATVAFTPCPANSAPFATEPDAAAGQAPPPNRSGARRKTAASTTAPSITRVASSASHKESSSWPSSRSSSPPSSSTSSVGSSPAPSAGPVTSKAP